MDIVKAKEFIYRPLDEEKLYISKDIWKLIEVMKEHDECISFIFAVIETESGDTLCNVDYAYDGEPIIMGRFIHKDYFINHYNNREITEL